MRQILISKKQSFSSLGYQISSCASKLYCSGGMHLNTVISELNGMAYKLHSKITKKKHILTRIWMSYWETILIYMTYFSNPTAKELPHLPFKEMKWKLIYQPFSKTIKKSGEKSFFPLWKKERSVLGKHMVRSPYSFFFLPFCMHSRKVNLFERDQ